MAPDAELFPVQPADPAPAPKEHPHRKLTRPGTRMDTGSARPRTDLTRPDPLAGDHIMDATARLLAPRKPMFAQAQEPRREAPKKAKSPRREEPKAAPKQEEKRRARPDRRRDRGPRPPMEPMKAFRTKDSTEQKSLMKPYYLDN